MTMRKLTIHDLDRAQRRRCSPFIEDSGFMRIDTDKMLSSGSLEGPYRTPRPITLTLRMRVARALRNLFLDRRSPL